MENKGEKMKQTYGIMGLVGVFLLLIGAASAYAYSTNNVGNGMMGSNTNYRNMMNTHNRNYAGMMGNIDKKTRDQMDEIHDQIIKNLDPETAKQMDAMHDACMGDNDDD